MPGMPMRRGWLLCALLLCARPVLAQTHEEDARAQYAAGKLAYESRRWDDALEAFKRSYTLSGQPALLYNIAATLQQLNRPGEAADTLREFLKERPNDPDAGELTKRIETLSKAQVLIDRDHERKRKIEAELRAAEEAKGPKPGWLTEAEAERRLDLEKATARRRKRKLGLAIGLPLGVLAIGGVTAAIVCGLGHCSSETKDYDFSKATVTP